MSDGKTALNEAIQFSQLFCGHPYFMKLVRKLPVDIKNYTGKAKIK
ncbi:hypothetical protein [Ruminiclostridium cellobioparum]|nr:hypothetical protein [Ruminiclostridium cellobioparum]